MDKPTKIDKFCVNCNFFAENYRAIMTMISFIWGTHKFMYQKFKEFDYCAWCGEKLIIIEKYNGMYLTTVQKDGSILLHPELLDKVGFKPLDDVRVEVKNGIIIVKQLEE